MRWLSPLACIAALRSALTARRRPGEPGQQLGRLGQALLPLMNVARMLTASRPPLLCLHAYKAKDIPPEECVSIW